MQIQFQIHKIKHTHTSLLRVFFCVYKIHQINAFKIPVFALHIYISSTEIANASQTLQKIYNADQADIWFSCHRDLLRLTSHSSLPIRTTFLFSKLISPSRVNPKRSKSSLILCPLTCMNFLCVNASFETSR